MLGNLEKHIADNLPFLHQKQLLVAISGGLDSVVLAHLFYKLHFSLGFAHCNFQLRGDESDADAAFVMDFAKQLQVPVFTKHFDTNAYAESQKISIQMAARELRYEWFKQLAKEQAYDYILTAHHANDAVETFLINLSRGTGIDGLVGIPEKNENVIRPLLPFKRSEILAYATTHGLQWREDSSNAETKYIRNKVRHEIVPLLEEIQPNFTENVLKTQTHLQESKTIQDASIQELKEKLLVTTEKGNIKIDIKRLKTLPNAKAYIYILLRDYGFTSWDDMIDLLDAQSGKQLFSTDYRLVKDRGFLLLQERSQSNAEVHSITIYNVDTMIQKPVLLQMEEVEKVAETGKNVLYVDKDMLKFPLTLRKWKNGDYFYPFGMRGKKKLSKFFKDEKYSLIDKENQWLLCTEDQIIWIIGKRSDNRFKLTKQAKNLIKFTLQ